MTTGRIILIIGLGILMFFLMLGGCGAMAAAQHQKEERQECALLHTYQLKCVGDMAGN